MTFKSFSYFFMLSFFVLLQSCNPEQTTTEVQEVSAEENEPQKVDTLTQEATTDKAPSYLIQDKVFQNIKIGSEISAATNVKKGVLQNGEGDFDVFYILTSTGEELGYILPDSKNEALVGQIVVTSPLAKTEKGLSINMTYGELEKILPNFEVHGSEIESRTYVTGEFFDYRLDENNSSYNLDKSKISKEAKIIEIYL